MNILDPIREQYAISGVANVFLITGNVHDFQPVSEQLDEDQVTPYVKLPLLLQLSLPNDFNLVGYYDLHSWKFGRNSDEEARQLQTIKGVIKTDEGGGMAAALNAASGSTGPLSTVPRAAFNDTEDLLTGMAMLQEASPCAIIMNYTESYLASGGWGMNADTDDMVVRLLRWARSTSIRNASHLIILLCSEVSALHPALRDPDNGIHKINVKYPTRPDRRGFIKDWISHTVDESKTEKPDGVEAFEEGLKKLRKVDVDELARASAGLNYVALENVLMRSLTANRVSFEFVKQMKDDIIRTSSDGLLEVMEPEWGWEFIDGLDYIKDLMKKNIVDPMKSGNTDRVAKGVLMCGAPGTGKSVVAEALAKECGLPMSKLRMSKMFDKWVGSSERNMNKVTTILESLGGIVFIDEIDQAGHSRGQPDGSSGTNSRVFQELLEFMGDSKHRGNIVFLAATNRPDLIDPAMKRPGRFDKRVVFMPPDKNDRSKILKAIGRKYGIYPDARSKGGFGKAADAVAERTVNWVGADLEVLVLKAKEIKEDEGGTYEHALMESIKVILPGVQQKDVDFMTGLGLREVNDLSTLPKWALAGREQMIETASKRVDAHEEIGFRSLPTKRGKKDKED